MKTTKTHTIILFLIIFVIGLAAASCEQPTGDQGGIAEAEPAIEIAGSFDSVSPYARFSGGDQDCKQPVVDSFLKLKDIDGGSTDPDHEEEIDIFSWGWSASNSGTLHNNGRGIGRVRMKARPFAITKLADRSSPELKRLADSGEPVSEAVFSIRMTCGEQVQYFVIELEDVVISSYQSTGSSGSSRQVPTEKVTFNYSKIALLLPAVQKVRDANR